MGFLEKHLRTKYYLLYDPCSVPLEPLFMEGSLPPTAYNVVKDQEFRGEIRVGLTFTPEVILCFYSLTDHRCPVGLFSFCKCIQYCTHLFSLQCNIHIVSTM